MRRREFIAGLGGVAALAAVIVPISTATAAEPVDLLLVLASDVSHSIDTAKFKVQRDGYIAALSDPRLSPADLIVGSLGYPCCLPEGAHDIFSGDHTHQLTIGTYDRKAAVPEANHQLQNACQRCRWFDMNNRFCHYVCHSSTHQLIEMGHNLTGCEGERPKEIQLGDYAEYFFCFHYGKSVEIMFLK